LPDYSYLYYHGKKAYGVSGSWRNSFYGKSDSNGKMRTIETTLEHIAHEVADEYRLSVT
jgi:hypothetical protein